jgi:hypothetical protein
MSDDLRLVGHEDPLKTTIKCIKCNWTAPAPLPMGIEELVAFGVYMAQRHNRESRTCEIDVNG